MNAYVVINLKYYLILLRLYYNESWLSDLIT